MGRSQVERNRTHGRPGKGRNAGSGRGGQRREDTSHFKNLGSNEFRYESQSMKESNESESAIISEESIIMTDYTYSTNNEFGPSHYSVAHDFYGDRGLNSDDDCNNSILTHDTDMDIAKLNECLETDQNFDYLRFDKRMTDMFRSRFYNGKKCMKMTVTELRALGSSTCQMQINQGDYINCEEERVNIQGSDEQEQVAEKNTDGDENLEDWLDNMIGT